MVSVDLEWEHEGKNSQKTFPLETFRIYKVFHLTRPQSDFTAEQGSFKSSGVGNFLRRSDNFKREGSY